MHVIYLFGMLGFYTGFIRTAVQATAAVVGVLAVAVLGGLALRWHQARCDGNTQHGLILPAAFLLLLVSAVTYVAFNPPAVRRVGSVESCLYDVPAASSIPITPGGFISTTIHLEAARIHAFSAVIGLDEKIANIHRAHPVKLQWRVPSRDLSGEVVQRDIVRDRYTRFNFPSPIDAGSDLVDLELKVVNESEDPIGIYVKSPAEPDVLQQPSRGIVVEGHRQQEERYSRPDLALTGCVAGAA